jgi:hypothetical protein
LHNNVFRSSRLFLYLGFGLILLSLVFLPIMTKVNFGSPDWPDYEDFPIGFILFAPIIGSYGLTSLTLGIAEVSMSKKENLLFFLPIFGLIYIWTSFVVWNVVWNILRLGFDYYPFWWLYLIIHLIPSITVSVIGFLNFAKKEYLSRVLKEKVIRIAAFSMIITVPLVYVAALWLLYLTLVYRRITLEESL